MDLPYFFGSDVPRDIRGVVSLGFGVVSCMIAIANGATFKNESCKKKLKKPQFVIDILRAEP
jgi:hypothetical protein